MGDATPPTAPEKEGHTFTNWCASCKEIKENTSIYAVYEKNTYTVRFIVGYCC